MRVGIVSGYFNPLHYGHIEYINAAKDESDHLIVIINNDHQIELKGSRKFMDEVHRSKIVENLKAVDEIVISVDQTKFQCETLKIIRFKYPEVSMSFFNSGDRIGKDFPIEEIDVCLDVGITPRTLYLPKLYSSSDLLKDEPR